MIMSALVHPKIKDKIEKYLDERYALGEVETTYGFSPLGLKIKTNERMLQDRVAFFNEKNECVGLVRIG